MVAVQQLPLPEKNFGLRGQKFDFRAFYSPLWLFPGFASAGVGQLTTKKGIKTKVVQNVNRMSER